MKIDLIEIISKFAKIKRDEIREDSELVKDLKMDSLDLFMMIQYLEDEYNIHLTETDIFDLHKVKDIQNYYNEYEK